ncbi:MAG: hypothetical protein WC712_01035 [Candidatus Brocadiia bacterium]
MAGAESTGFRYLFNVWYRLVGVITSLMLILSSVSYGGGVVSVIHPIALFLGAVFGAITLALFTIPYLRIVDGGLWIYIVLSNREIRLKNISKFVLDEGDRVTIHLADGATARIMLFHVSKSERAELLRVLGNIATLERPTRRS